MKILNECSKLFLSVGIFFVCFFGMALADLSWQERACIRNYGGISCTGLSQNYTEPYCLTNAIDTKNLTFQCINMPLTNTLSPNGGKTKLSDFSMRDILKNYCSLLYSDSGEGRIYFAKPNMQTTGWDWQQTFDSHQSLFLYALCSSFKDKEGEMLFLSGHKIQIAEAFSGDLTKSLKLQQMDGNGKNLCFPEDENYDLNDCDMAIYATKIYEAIMTDLYKIQYAQVLNVDTVENFNVEEKVLDFMIGYDLNDQEYIKLKNNYPKSLSILESNQMFYKKKVLQTVKIIDNNMLAGIAKDKKKKCLVTGNMMTGVNFVACALHSSQRNKFALTPSFVTLIYNEILHYRQFIMYHQLWLQKKKEESGVDDEKKLLLDSKMSDFNWLSEKQIEATKLVQHDFEDFNMSYPLHIGLLMYIEKVEKFRNNGLSKVITLFYSLSERLQNVQQPGS